MRLTYHFYKQFKHLSSWEQIGMIKVPSFCIIWISSHLSMFRNDLEP